MDGLSTCWSTAGEARFAVTAGSYVLVQALQTSCGRTGLGRLNDLRIVNDHGENRNSADTPQL